MPDNHYYRHIDGGLYRLLHNARHADDASEVIVYEHLWPFEPGIWVRRADEFRQRFHAIDAGAYQAIVCADRISYQQQVTAAKAARRASRG